jgi:MFS family permease
MSDAADKGGMARRTAVVVWLLASIYYFYQYTMRSAPGVMLPQLQAAFGLSAAGVGSLVGLFYYGYAAFSLVAGVALDRLGPRKVMPVGAAMVGVGALMFASGDVTLASLGTVLRGAGGSMALVGAAYLAARDFPASMAATLIGATQMFGMAGGAAGQFAVGPAMAGGLGWREFWIGMGVAGFPLAALLLAFTPRSAPAAGEWLRAAVGSIGAVLRNPVTLLCGAISGLMFVPTTIFSMVWGVRFLQDSHDMPFTVAVLRSAAVPAGWIIGCPLMGALSDRLGRRKAVIAACAAALTGVLVLILYGPTGVFPPYSLGLFAGIVSGAAMIPYTVAKEANRPEYSGTTAGVTNLLNFSITAVLGPLFGERLMRAAGGGPAELGHYRTAFMPLIAGVALALVLTLLLPETGRAGRARQKSPRPENPELATQ